MMHYRIWEIQELVGDCLDTSTSAFVWGPVGVGKSQGIKMLAKSRRAGQLAKLAEGMSETDKAALYAFSKTYPCFIDIRLSMFDPVDLRGLPCNVDGRTEWLRPGLWPLANPYGLETVIFFDEFDRAVMAVFNAALQIVLDRKIGEHELPETVRIVAAGNGETDKGTNKLPLAACNRFAHYHTAYDPEATRDHFNAIALHPLIVAFLHLRPMLGHIDAIRAAAQAEGNTGEFKAILANIGKAFPTPRQWEEFNKFVNSPRRHKHAKALLGDNVADEFEAFFQIFSTLPPLATILANPAGAPLVTDLSGFYAIASALARAAKPGNFAAVQTYLARLPKEFRTMSTVDAVRRDPGLKETAAFVAWAIENQDVTI